MIEGRPRESLVLYDNPIEVGSVVKLIKTCLKFFAFKTLKAHETFMLTNRFQVELIQTIPSKNPLAVS